MRTFGIIILGALTVGCSTNRVVVIEGAVDLDLRRVETTGDGCGVGIEGTIPENVCLRYVGENCTVGVGAGCDGGPAE